MSLRQPFLTPGLAGRRLVQSAPTAETLFELRDEAHIMLR